MFCNIYKLMDAVVSELPSSDELPARVEAELAQLEVLSDDVLWQVARSRFARDQANKLERLHLKAQRQTLTMTEQKSENSFFPLTRDRQIPALTAGIWRSLASEFGK